MNKFIIDTETKGHKEIIRRLNRLKSTIDLVDNGYYRQIPECSKVTIETTLTEEQLEDWLWENNFYYVGVCDDN